MMLYSANQSHCYGLALVYCYFPDRSGRVVSPFLQLNKDVPFWGQLFLLEPTCKLSIKNRVFAAISSNFLYHLQARINIYRWVYSQRQGNAKKWVPIIPLTWRNRRDRGHTSPVPLNFPITVWIINETCFQWHTIILFLWFVSQYLEMRKFCCKWYNRFY